MRKATPQSLLSNHQKSWLWGTVPLWETLTAGRWPIRELLVAETAQQTIHEQCLQMAEAQQIPCRRESSSRIEQLCKAKDHQGIAALMGPFPYAEFAEIQQAIAPRSLLVMLDRLQDPHNVGAIIRSAAAFGCAGLVLGKQSQVGITSHVARSSAGAVNHLPICQVESLAAIVEQAQHAGVQVLATAMAGSLPVQQIRNSPEYSKSPLLLIIGNEATGVADELLSLCNATVCIPMSGQVESLNAAVAAGILLFSLSVQ